MSDFGQFSAEATHDSYDNDFERLDVDDPDKVQAGENPEEDLYSADPSHVPTADLLSFGAGDNKPAQYGGFDAGFGNPIPEAVPDSTTNLEEQQKPEPAGGPAQSEPFSVQPVDVIPPAAAPTSEPEAVFNLTDYGVAKDPTEPSLSTKAHEPTPTPPSSPALGALIDSSKIDPRVVELIYWRDPKKSGIVFGGVLLILLFLSLCSFISVVACLLLAVMTVTISFRVYKTVMQAVQKTGDGNPFKAYLDMDMTLTKQHLDSYLDKVIEKINAHSGCLRHLLLVEDLVDSIKFAVFLWLLTYVGAWFNGLTLVMLGWIDLFVLPIVYEKFQVQIDDAVGKAQVQVNTAVDSVKAKIPWLKKKED